VMAVREGGGGIYRAAFSNESAFLAVTLSERIIWSRTKGKEDSSFLPYFVSSLHCCLTIDNGRTMR
jgi:hypothetical protein